MLKQAIDDYLAVRRAAGFDLGVHGNLLHSFERFASERGETHVRARTAIEWASLAPSSGQQEHRLSVVGIFARHARAEDPRHEIPPKRVFPYKARKWYMAFIFSPRDIRRIMDAASRLEPQGSFLPDVYCTLFGLLAATGMRVSEALALRFDDVTPDGLVIRRTKFRKSRLLPLHKTTEAALIRYLEKRRQTGGANDHLFIALRGKPLYYSVVQKTFQEIVCRLGLHPEPDRPGPRLHDFRHTFAVRALESCPIGRRDLISRHMLALSTYLGHSCVSLTHWYLQLTPRQTADIADACEAFFKEDRS